MASKETTHTKKNKPSWFSERLKDYEFAGVDQNNVPVRGQIRARNYQEARRQLIYRNIRLKKIKVIRPGLARRIQFKDITLLTRQLSSMLKAGVSMLHALDLIGAGSGKKKLQLMLTDIKNRVEQGEALSEALNHHPKYFDQLYIGLVQSGEKSGLLDLTLDRIATQREKIQKIRGNLKKAMVYPVTVIVVALGVVIFMMVWIIPIFRNLYRDMGVELPAITRFVLNISDFIGNYWWQMLLVFALGGYAYHRSYKRNKTFRRSMTRLFFKIPVLGNFLKKAEVSKWARTFSNLYGVGLIVTEVLDLIANQTLNIVVKEATEQIRAQVEQGERLANCIRARGDIFPLLFIQLVEVGEEAGTLEDMMGRAADYFEEEVDNLVGALQTIIEPIIIILLGVIVGVILVAMYTPLFDLSSHI